MVLEEYSSILSFIASSAMLPLLLSPALLCKDFMKKGSADHMNPFIFVQGLIRSSIFIQFGILSGLNALFRIHSLGLALYIIYFTLYFQHCSNKRPALVSLTKSAIFVTTLLGYVNHKPNSLIASYFEHITTVIHLGLMALPLLNLKEVIRRKSTAGMPFPIIFCATVVNILWLLFGISVNNSSLICQTFIGSILTGVQLSLFVIYPQKAESKQEKSKKKKN